MLLHCKISIRLWAHHTREDPKSAVQFLLCLKWTLEMGHTLFWATLRSLASLSHFPFGKLLRSPWHWRGHTRGAAPSSGQQPTAASRAVTNMWSQAFLAVSAHQRQQQEAQEVHVDIRRSWSWLSRGLWLSVLGTLENPAGQAHGWPMLAALFKRDVSPDGLLSSSCNQQSSLSEKPTGLVIWAPCFGGFQPHLGLTPTSTWSTSYPSIFFIQKKTQFMHTKTAQWCESKCIRWWWSQKCAPALDEHGCILQMFRKGVQKLTLRAQICINEHEGWMSCSLLRIHSH